MTVRDIYDEVCEVFLESGGLTLGMVTESDFLRYFAEVYQSFLQQTGLIKSLISLVPYAGQTVYNVPDQTMDVQDALYAEKYIYRESGHSLDHMYYQWKNQSGTPQYWHGDRLEMKEIEIVPAPQFTGHPTVMSGGSGFYGTFASVSGNDVIFQTDSSGGATGFYGVLSTYLGPVFFNAPAALFGTVSMMEFSTANLTLSSTTKSNLIRFGLDDHIENVLNSFVPYLKYGVMAKLFGADSEAKDVQRAQYCRARFDEGILLAKAVSQELLEEEPTNA